MKSSPTPLLRARWRGLGLQGPVHCRRVRGAYRELWIVHHGRGYDPARNPERAVARFLSQAATALRRAGFSPRSFLFLLDGADERQRRGGRSDDPVADLQRAAMIEADRLPHGQWDATASRDWVPLWGAGDMIEMWEKSLQRSGRLYRIVETAYGMPGRHDMATEWVRYVGARRGARLAF